MKTEMTFKRYCKTLELKDDPILIEDYKRLHAHAAGWPEITQGMRGVGIIDMEIYIDGTKLFMIMDTISEFDHNTAMAHLAKLPRQSEWETLVSKYQKTAPGASAKEKWRLIERIYKMDQNDNSTSAQGYRERVQSYNNI